MNKIDLKRPTSIDDDFARWCAEQGALLRAGRLDQIDRDNLAEEIESLGRSDKREIRSRLLVLIHHLLKWQVQPEHRSGSWRATIRTQRDAILDLLTESPSLGPYPATVLAAQYALARANAADETQVPIGQFPAQCPWTVEQILDPDFLSA